MSNLPKPERIIRRALDTVEMEIKESAEEIAEHSRAVDNLKSHITSLEKDRDDLHAAAKALGIDLSKPVTEGA